MSGIRTKSAKVNRPQPLNEEKPFTTAALGVNVGNKILSTVDKWNETELKNSGVEDFAFNYNDGQGNTVTSKLFSRRPMEDGNFIKKHIGSSVRNPYDRIQVDPMSVNNFKYNDLTGNDAVRSMLTDKGLEEENINRILSEPKVDGDESIKGFDSLSNTLSKSKDTFKKYTEFAKDRNWRIMPGLSDSGVKETLNVYKNGEIVNRVQETMDKVSNISASTADVAASATESLIEEGTKKVGEEIASKAGEEVAKKFGEKVLSGIGSAAGVAQAGKGAKGILSGDINYKNVSDTVHGTISAAKPVLLTNPVGATIVAVSTIWDILDG